MTTSNLPTIFNYSNHEIRTLVGEDNNPWFVARDVFSALTIPWAGKRTLSIIPEAWRGVVKLTTPQKHSSGREVYQEQEIIIISEPAVYKLAFRSNKPEAEAFTEWVASEVLPSIRKTGQYTAPVSPSTLTPSEQHQIQQAVKAKAGDNHKSIPEIWGRIKNKFKVARYDQLLGSQLQDALAYIEGMKLKEAVQPPPEPQPSLNEMRLSIRVEYLEQINENLRESKDMYKSLYNDMIAILSTAYGRAVTSR